MSASPEEAPIFDRLATRYRSERHFDIEASLNEPPWTVEDTKARVAAQYASIAQPYAVPPRKTTAKKAPAKKAPASQAHVPVKRNAKKRTAH